MHRRTKVIPGEEDMEVAAVSDDGRVLIRFFGGSSIELSVPPHLVPYYRRLQRPAHR